MRILERSVGDFVKKEDGIVMGLGEREGMILLVLMARLAILILRLVMGAKMVAVRLEMKWKWRRWLPATRRAYPLGTVVG